MVDKLSKLEISHKVIFGWYCESLWVFSNFKTFKFSIYPNNMFKEDTLA